MYVAKSDDAFYYTVLVTHYLHYYPLVENKKYYNVVSAVLRVLTCYIWVDSGLHCFTSVKNHVPVDISEDIAVVTGLGSAMTVCIMFEVNVKRWSRLFMDITDTTRFGTPKNITAVIKRASSYSLVYFIYATGGICIYTLYSLFNTGPCDRLNKEKGLHEICGTITPLWWPYEEISPVTKFFVTIFKLISAAFYLPPAAILIFVSWEAAEIIIAKIHHVKELFENAFDTNDRDSQIRRLKFCIRYHQEIIRLSEELNEVTKRQSGHLAFVAAVILSCIGTQMLKEYSIGALIHLMGQAVAAFLVCQTGQKLLDETYNIQDAVYASKWYNIDPKLAKDMQMILLRSQKPVYIESIPLGIFNYSLLIVILKTSYSYLALINSTTK